MSRFLSPRLFTLTFAIVYAIVVIGNYPLFIYYPEVGQFSLTDLGTATMGPEMFYFGWIASAAVVALVPAVIIPKDIANRVPDGVFWLLPFIMFGAGFYRESDWFLL